MHICENVKPGKHYVAQLCGALAIFACMVGVTACSTGDSKDNVLTVKHESILLAPDIEAGSVGWCIVNQSGGFCPQGPAREPIIAQSWSSRKPPPVTEAYAVMSNDVAAVSFHGQRVATYAESGLPDGIRAVAVEMKGLYAPKVRHHLTARSVTGDRIPERVARTSPLSDTLPTRSVEGKSEGHDACGLEAESSDGIRVGQGRIVRRVRPYASQLGESFLACTSRFYELQGASLTASMLLSAEHPGTQPAALPAMRPLHGHPGVFQAPGFGGDIVARRMHGAWLVVGKGQNVDQRVRLLEHLRGVVRIT